MRREIRKICCAGAGTIGTGWTVSFAVKGYPVNLYEIDPNRIESAQFEIKKIVHYLAEQGAIARHDVKDALARITYTTDLEAALKDVQLVSENAPENYETKQELLEKIDQYASRDTVYASSTSGLLISEISKFSSHPERCIGAHPYNPPYLIPLVEITKTEKTDPEVIRRSVNFYKDIGKEPVVLKQEAPGFIGNRLSYALYREAISLVMDGVCTIDEVDRAVTFGPGLRWAIFGPNMLYELGSTNGIFELFEKTGKMFDAVLSDLADWKAFPKNFPNLAQLGVKDEMANFSEHVGRTREDLIKFRDDMLINLLKLHRKF